MSNFVNKIKKGETEYDIQDVRLPDATAADAGNVLAVNDQGKLVLQQASSGGTQLYRHYIKIPCSWTYDGEQRTIDLYFDIISIESTQLNNLNKMYYVCSATQNHISTSGKNFYIYQGNLYNLSASAESTFCFIDRYAFGTIQRTYFDSMYPGAALKAYTYAADSIDLSTGEMKERVNLISNFSADIANSTDTVTEL